MLDRLTLAVNDGLAGLVHLDGDGEFDLIVIGHGCVLMPMCALLRRDGPAASSFLSCDKAVMILGCGGEFIMAQARPQPSKDPVSVDSEHYTVESENERVRILRIRYGPRAKSVMHSHPASVAVFLTDASCRFTFPDGRTENHDIKAGQAMFMPALEHLPENLSDKPLEVLQIELKG